MHVLMTSYYTHNRISLRTCLRSMALKKLERFMNNNFIKVHLHLKKNQTNNKLMPQRHNKIYERHLI